MIVLRAESSVFIALGQYFGAKMRILREKLEKKGRISIIYLEGAWN